MNDKLSYSFNIGKKNINDTRLICRVSSSSKSLFLFFLLLVKKKVEVIAHASKQMVTGYLGLNL